MVITVGQLRGAATYQFSKDRSTLVIVEGGTTDLIGDFLKAFGIVNPELATSSSPTTVFIKVSAQSETDPQEAKQAPATDVPDAASGEEPVSPKSAGTEAAVDGEKVEDVSSEEAGSDTESMLPPINDRSGPE